MSAAKVVANTVAKKAIKGAKHWPHQSPTFMVRTISRNDAGAATWSRCHILSIIFLY